MGINDKPTPGPDKVPSPGTTAIVIFATIADTTWRLFTPVIALLLVGMWLDSKTDHKPLFTLGGVLLGFGLAIALVYEQYQRVKGTSEDKKS